MPSQQETALSGKSHRSGKGFWIYFFRTIIALFIIIVILFIIGRVRAPSDELNQAAKLRIYEIVSEYTDQTLGTSFPNTEASIDQLIDNAFSPAYKNIEAFADVHYTVKGEYAELFYAAMGQLEEKIEEILFEGLQERLDVAVGQINTGFLDELAENIEAGNECSQDGMSKENESECRAAMDVAIDDMLNRFEATDLALKGSMAIGGGAAGVTITKAISAAIAKKLIPVLAAKTTGKATLKLSGGTAGGAATGAAIGSFIPGAGTVAGGIIGGVVGWFLVDKVVIEADEYLHRSDFEKEVATLIDEQKSLVKSEIRKYIDATITEVNNKTPLELIRSDT